MRECEHGRVCNAYGDGLGCPAECCYYEPRIDRGALLELADEMYEFGSLPVKHPGVRVLHGEDFSRELGYARRIREACGVGER